MTFSHLPWVLQQYSKFLKEGKLKEAEDWRKEFSHHEWAFKGCETIQKVIDELYYNKKEKL